MNDLAQEALVGKGTIYNHYLDKYDLAAQIMHNKLHAYQALIHQRIDALAPTSDAKIPIQQIFAANQSLIDELVLLSKIKTPEIDFAQEIKVILVQEFSRIIQESPQLKITEITNTAQLLAAITLEYFHKYAIAKQTFSFHQNNLQLQELIKTLSYFFSRNN